MAKKKKQKIEENTGFKYKKECEYCDNTGKINIKGKEFICPNCNCQVECKEVIEKIVDEPVKIKSVMSFKNKQNHWKYIVLILRDMV